MKRNTSERKRNTVDFLDNRRHPMDKPLTAKYSLSTSYPQDGNLTGYPQSSTVLLLFSRPFFYLFYMKEVAMKQKKKSIISIFLSILLVLSMTSHEVTVGAASVKEKGKIIRVIDGDTFVCLQKKKTFTVRLIGVDTPESVHTNKAKNTDWGRKVSQYTKKKLTGKTVYLMYDTQRTDIYGRILAYVYTKKKKTFTMFNKQLLKKGYARAICYEPNHKYKTVFARQEKQARKQKKGFWKDGYLTAFPER